MTEAPTFLGRPPSPPAEESATFLNVAPAPPFARSGSPLHDGHPGNGAATGLDAGQRPAARPSVATLTPLPSAAPAGTAAGRPGSTGFGHRADAGFGGPLAPGTQFGSRYHIIRLLGIGGMGAVYQAWDDSLGVAVAIKVIRPEVGGDADAARDLERRFKRELLLARQVTHRNVVRIHDLGEIDGITYITMPFIQGSDLATILAREGRLPVRRALAIARQSVAGLQAAHEAGVVHRDLKPANIMIDADDNALIMDFGIARSVAGGAGGTMAGAVVGTLEYMAPEQAMARPVDHRADLYSFGLILHDMLVGRREMARAESAVAELMQRIQHPVPPIRLRDASLPEPLEQVVARCLQPDPGSRFQTAAELAVALGAIGPDGLALGPGTTSPGYRLAPASGQVPVAPVGTAPGSYAAPTTPAPVAVPSRRPVPWKWVVPALVAVLAFGALAIYRFSAPRSTRATAGTTKVTSLAILPFRNASGDAALDWIGGSLADMVKTELSESPGLRVVSSDRLFQILRDLRISPDSNLDLATLQRLAEFSNADRLLTGEYERAGAAIQIKASLQFPSGGGPVLLRAEAATESELPTAVTTLARLLQDSLAPGAVRAGTAAKGTLAPSSSSTAALKSYAEAAQLSRQGNHLGALKALQAATAADPQFALAYSKLGQTYASLGYGQEAKQAARKAVELSGKLPEAERYRVLATAARIADDHQKAIEAYQNVLRIAPDDSQVRFDLAGVYEGTGAYDQAREEYAQVLQRDPKYGDAVYAMGRIEIKRGNPRGALDFLNRAFGLAVQTDNDEAKGTVLHAIGAAYKLLDKPEDALRNYQEAVEIRRRIGDKRGLAISLQEIGQAQDILGRFDAALTTYQEALQLAREIEDKRALGTILLNFGVLRERRSEFNEALGLYKDSLQFWLEVGDEGWQGLCLNNVGNLYLLLGQYDDALTYFERALRIREKLNVASEIAETQGNIALVLAKTGQYDKALSTSLKALDLRRRAGDRRGTAIESVTLGAIFEVQGRYGPALDAREEALKAFRDIKDDEWLARSLNGVASSLVLLGRFEEARKRLDESLEVARALKNPRLEAETLNLRGDSFFLEGETRAARPLYDRALLAATKGSDREGSLLAKLNLAKLDVREGRGRTAPPRLAELAAQADALRLPLISVQCTLYEGEALLGAKPAASARVELEAALQTIEKLGLRGLLPRAHFLLAQALQQAGDAEGAARHTAEAGRFLQEMRKEARTDDLLKRIDLQPIVAATRSAS